MIARSRRGAPAVDVGDVDLDALGPGDRVAAADLRQPRQARAAPAGGGADGRRSAPPARRRSGRGPTRLMSPRTTFHSWGSSSSDSRRRARPSGVMRSSPRDQRGPAPIRSAPTTIVRNLSSVNGSPGVADAALAVEGRAGRVAPHPQADGGQQRRRAAASGTAIARSMARFARPPTGPGAAGAGKRLDRGDEPRRQRAPGRSAPARSGGRSRPCGAPRRGRRRARGWRPPAPGRPRAGPPARSRRAPPSA